MKNKRKREASSQPIPSECSEQVAIFKRAHLYARRYPELRFLNGSLNGVRLTIGQAVKCKKAGMREGHPDIQLPVCRGGYIGLYIELKRIKGGKISPAQKDWAEFLISQGYMHRFCKGCDEAWDVIINYLNLKNEK